VLTSVVGAFYYLRVIKVMYFDAAEPAFDVRPTSVSFVAGVGALVTTLFFVFPAPLVAAAQQAARVLFG
jgi:NADH-quinone oxidoreductase subunit N